MKATIFLIMTIFALAACTSKQKMTTPPAPSVEQPQEAEPQQVVVDLEGTVKVQEEEVTLTHGTEMMSYCVILGSFANDRNAVDFHNTLQNLGFVHGCIMQNKQGMNRVAAVCLDNEQTARVELLKIRQRYPQFKDAWLLKTEQK